MDASDEADFREFVVGQWHALARTAYLLTGDRGDAEDLVQSTLVRVHRRWTRIERTDAPYVYARRVMVNLNTSIWRRTRISHHLTDAPPEPARPGAPDSMYSGSKPTALSCSATHRAQSASPLVVARSPVLEVSKRISALTSSTTSSAGTVTCLSYHWAAEPAATGGGYYRGSCPRRRQIPAPAGALSRLGFGTVSVRGAKA